MNKRTLLWSLLSLAGLMSLGLAGCRRTAPAQDTDRLPVVVSIAPLADLVEQVGGQRVQVTQMVPLGSNPHTYEPTPAQMEAVSQARLLVLNGAGLEHWAEDVVQAAQNPDLRVVRLAEGLPLLDRNPHLWLNPRLMMRYADKVADALAALDPAGATTYRQQAEAYKAQLADLDADIRAALAEVPSRKVVTLHPAWDYFAQEYGLEVVGVIQPTPGQEPSPAAIAALVAQMRAEGVTVVIVETQPTPPAARVVADEAGARVVYMEPLGGPPPLDSYLGLMRTNVQALVEALAAQP